MAKQKKNNYSIIPSVPLEAIAAVRGEEDFVELLWRELEWPSPMLHASLAVICRPPSVIWCSAVICHPSSSSERRPPISDFRPLVFPRPPPSGLFRPPTSDLGSLAFGHLAYAVIWILLNSDFRSPTSGPSCLPTSDLRPLVFRYPLVFSDV